MTSSDEILNVSITRRLSKTVKKIYTLTAKYTTEHYHTYSQCDNIIDYNNCIVENMTIEQYNHMLYIYILNRDD